MSAGRSLIDDLLARGVDDWIYAAEVFDVTSAADLRDPSDRRALALGLIAEVLVAGLMEAGVVEGKRFTAWTCSPTEALGRIAEDWLSRPDPMIMPGEIAWLNNTASGNARGEAVIARERA